MNLTDRVNILTTVFDDLQETSSLNMKRVIIDEIPLELKEDFEFVLECLAGKHVFGYTFTNTSGNFLGGDIRSEDNTVKDVLEFLLEPKRMNDLSNYNIIAHISQVRKWYTFFEAIVDKTLKLGIGKSVLPKDGLSVMLAKKYEGKIKDSKDGYFITEKLDGNRCVARYDGTKWLFTSRNGKPMHVDFDMSGLPKEYVYDGEILSPQQVEMSKVITAWVSGETVEKKCYDSAFNSTSGLINRHDKNKELVYNIFDIMYDDVTYLERREVLDKLSPTSSEVRVLPLLGYCKDKNTLDMLASNIMNSVVSIGGEGVMINLANAKYQHKRTDGILKLKPVYSMDMKVVAIEYGTGKYEYCVGALICEANVPGLGVIRCKVGTGLSDAQRESWAVDSSRIVGKIIEVGYFDISQDSNSFGTNVFSLRFPRLVKVRTDKNETSIY